MAKYDYPIIVIGAGAAGLVIAIGAAKAGKKVLLIDRGSWGGECTNSGCIPSKALIACSKVAHGIRQAKNYGIHFETPSIETTGAFDYTRQCVQHFVDHESPKALKAMGVDTQEAIAAFVDKHTLRLSDSSGGEHYVSGDQIIIATGSHPLIPQIKGLDQVSYLTNETVFQLKALPPRLAIIGGGAIGCELAQSFQRLGSSVTLIEFFDHILSKEEPEAKAVLEPLFAKEGIHLLTGQSTESVEQTGEGIRIHLQKRSTGEEQSILVDQLLIAVGRLPNVDKLCLDNAGITFNHHGIKTNAYGQTRQRNIWAIGDVTGKTLFTHAAEIDARAVLTSLLLPWPFKKRLDRRQALPRVTYTDPEVAAVGLTEAEAIERYGENKVAIYQVPLSAVDRAICTGHTEGVIKVITKKWSSRILGATIICARAGEMLPEISTAMYAGLPLRKLRSLIHPYPTYNQGIRKAADLWLLQTILPTIRSWLKK